MPDIACDSHNIAVYITCDLCNANSAIQTVLLKLHCICTFFSFFFFLVHTGIGSHGYSDPWNLIPVRSHSSHCDLRTDLGVSLTLHWHPHRFAESRVKCSAGTRPGIALVPASHKCEPGLGVSSNANAFLCAFKDKVNIALYSADRENVI